MFSTVVKYSPNSSDRVYPVGLSVLLVIEGLERSGREALPPEKNSGTLLDFMLSVDAHRMGSSLPTTAASDVTPWHGAIEVVIAAPVEKVWAIASDWLNFPRRCSLECAEGQNGVPGCVRKVRAPNSNFWVAEKLTCLDHERHILAYDLVGGNSGIESGFQAAFQAIDEGESRTRVVWPFMFSPKQVSVESLTAIVQKKVKAHVKELEQLAQAS